MEESQRERGRLLSRVISYVTVVTLAMGVIYALETAFDLDLFNGGGLEGMGWIVVMVLLLPLQPKMDDVLHSKLRQRSQS